MHSKLLRIAAIVNFCYSIMYLITSELKDTGLYAQKGKRLIGQLSDFIYPLLSSSKREKIILGRIKITNEEELDNLTEDELMVYTYVKNAMSVLIEGGPEKVFEVNMCMENIMKGKRLYTEEEYNMKSV